MLIPLWSALLWDGGVEEEWFLFAQVVTAQCFSGASLGLAAADHKWTVSAPAWGELEVEGRGRETLHDQREGQLLDFASSLTML